MESSMRRKLEDWWALHEEWLIHYIKRFQEMEEKRIEFLHHSLCVYVNILSTASGQDQEVSDTHPQEPERLTYILVLRTRLEVLG